MTRLNGMPIQMFATITDISAQSGEVSQPTGSTPKKCRKELTTPDSLLNIHDHVDADTISGSSHGIRNSARNVVDSGNRRMKNTARPRPMENWKISDTMVNTKVCVKAGQNVGLW